MYIALYEGLNGVNHQPSIGQTFNHQPSIGQTFNHQPSIGQTFNHQPSIGQTFNHQPSIGQTFNHQLSKRGIFTVNHQKERLLLAIKWFQGLSNLT